MSAHIEVEGNMGLTGRRPVTRLNARRWAPIILFGVMVAYGVRATISSEAMSGGELTARAAVPAQLGRLERVADAGGLPGPIAAEADRLYRAIGGRVEAWRFDDRDREPVFLGDTGELGVEIREVAVRAEQVLVSIGARYTPGELLQWDARSPRLGRVDWRIRTPMSSPASGIAIVDGHAWLAGGGSALALYALRGSLEPQLVATGRDVVPDSLAPNGDGLLAVASRAASPAEPTPNASENFHAVVRLPEPSAIRDGAFTPEASAPLPGKRWFTASAHLPFDAGEGRGLVVWEGARGVEAVIAEPDGALDVEHLSTLAEPVAGGAAMHGKWAWIGLADGRLLGMDVTRADTITSSLTVSAGPPAHVAAGSASRVWVADRAGRTVAVDVSQPLRPREAGVIAPRRFRDVASDGESAWALLGNRIVALDQDGVVGGVEPIDTPLSVGAPRALLVEGDQIYVDSERGLFPIELGGARPLLRESLLAPGHPALETTRRASGAGFVAAAARGQVFVWPAADPRTVVELDLPESSPDTAAFFGAGRDLWIAAGTAGDRLQRIDVSDPRSPRVAQRTPPLAGGAIVAVDARDDLAVLGSGNGRLLTLDLSDPASAAVLGSLDMGRRIERVVIRGSRAWVIWRDGNQAHLSVVDLRVPERPDELAMTPLTRVDTAEGRTLAPVLDHAHLVRNGTLETWRLTLPDPATAESTATATGRSTTPSATPSATPADPRPTEARILWQAQYGGSAGPIVAEEERLLRVVGSRIETWRLALGSQTPVRTGISAPLDRPPRAMALHDGKLWASVQPFASRNHELQRWDARGPRLSASQWRLPIGPSAARRVVLDASGTHAWLAQGTAGTKGSTTVVELNASDGPRVVAALEGVWAKSLAAGDEGMWAVRDRPARPGEPTPNLSQVYQAFARYTVVGSGIEETAVSDLPGRVSFADEPSVAIEDGSGIVVRSSTQSALILRADGSGGWSVGEPVALPEWPRDVVVQAGTAWLANYRSGIMGLDLHDRRAISVTFGLAQGDALGQLVAGEPGRLWAATLRGHAHALDVRDQSAPRQDATLPAEPRYQDVIDTEQGGWALAADHLVPLDPSGRPIEEAALALPEGEMGRGLATTSGWLFVRTDGGIYPLSLTAATPVLGPSLLEPELAGRIQRSVADDRHLVLVGGLAMWVWTPTPDGVGDFRRTDLPSATLAMALDGSRLWLASSSGSVNPDRLVQYTLDETGAASVGGVTPALTSAAILALWVQDGRAVIGDGVGGLQVVDLRDLNAPRGIGSLDMGQFVLSIDVDARRGGLWVTWRGPSGDRLSLIALDGAGELYERLATDLRGVPLAVQPTRDGVWVAANGALDVGRVPDAVEPGRTQTPLPARTASATPRATATGTATPTAPSGGRLWLPRVIRE